MQPQVLAVMSCPYHAAVSMYDHKFSIGLISGPCPGQSQIKGTPQSVIHCFTDPVISQLSVVVVSVVMRYLASFAPPAHIAFSIFSPDTPDKQRSVSGVLGTVEEPTLSCFGGKATQAGFRLVYTSVLYIYTISNIYQQFYSC